MEQRTKDLPQPPPVPPGLVTAATLSGAPTPAEGVRAMAQVAQMEKAANTATEQNNPAEAAAAEKMLRERGPRLSLNAPSRRLEAPPLPGYHLHWFLERNIPKALAGWYEFVTPQEMPTVDASIGGRTEGSTSDDLGGARIAAIAGTDEQGKPEQLVLMKIRQEWFFREQRKIAERNLAIIQQVFHKRAPVMAPEESRSDYGMRYTREAVIDMSNGRFRKE
jgi:hypothetical protein